MDLGTSGGQWLYKDKDLLMGPVPAKVIIDKLGAGEIAPGTMVADEDLGEWMALDQVAFFKIHVARAQARARVLKDKQSEELQAKKRSRRHTLFLVQGAAGLIALVGGGAFWWVSSTRIGESSAELSDIGITISPPVIALASLSKHRKEGGAYLDVEVADAAGSGGREAAESGSRSAGNKGRRLRGSAASASSKGGSGSGSAHSSSTSTSVDADGLATTTSYDMGHIQSVLKNNSRSLFPCIKAEVARTGFKGAIPFEFVVTNAGRVGKVWIDNKVLRGTPMEACFQETMSKWRFKSFAGERPTVSQSFTIGGAR